MSNDKEKRRLLGIEDGEPLPTFGKRKAQPPKSGGEESEHDLADFRNEARSLLQQGRDRADAERAEAKEAGKKAGILNLIRRKNDAEEPQAVDELSEEEEWRRRMSGQKGPGDATG